MKTGVGDFYNKGSSMRKSFTVCLAACGAWCLILLSMPRLEAGIWNDDKDGSDSASSISVAKGMSRAEMAVLAKLSLLDAVKVAVKEVDGQAVKASLRREHGFLVYEVSVLTSNRGFVGVTIDPGDGKILEVEKGDDD